MSVVSRRVANGDVTDAAVFIVVVQLNEDLVRTKNTDDDERTGDGEGQQVDGSDLDANDSLRPAHGNDVMINALLLTHGRSMGVGGDLKYYD